MNLGLAVEKREGEAVDIDPGSPPRKPLTPDQQLRHDMLFQWRIAVGHLEDAAAIAARLDPGYTSILRISINDLERDFQFVAGAEAVAEESGA